MTSITQQFIDLRPHGGFDLIVADPPWSFDNFSAKGEAKNAKAQYDCTPLDWIKSLPVQILAADDCLCFLWATNPMLPDAMQVLDAWGFTFKTAGHWVKRTKHGKIAFGTGYILRCAGEPFLIGTRGQPKTTRSTRSVIEGPIREHSRKPDEAFAAAEKLMPDAKRVELFSRQQRAGWTVWGNQVDKFQEDAA
jgi:N6-adenosine-specific RNA methylase IME4